MPPWSYKVSKKLLTTQAYVLFWYTKLLEIGKKFFGSDVDKSLSGKRVQLYDAGRFWCTPLHEGSAQGLACVILKDTWNRKYTWKCKYLYENIA